MADNTTVSNSPSSSNPDIPVRTSETAGGKQIQHMRLDLGSGSTESTVSGSVPISDNGGSITVDASSLPLPTGAATEATLSTLNGKVTACDTGAVTIAAMPNEGQQTMANSISVAIASNQSAVPVSDNGITLSVDDGAGSLTVDGTIAATQSGTWNVNNISGTVSLPTGAATSANQSTEITSLQLIDDLVLAEDAVHASGAAGILALSRRADTASSSAGTDGDYATLNTDANGRLHVADTRTGASAQNVQGPSAVGASITTGNLFPCGFKDLFGNGVVPTGLDASGVIVMGVLPLDLALNVQDFSAAGEVYSLAAATANSSATARYITVTSAGEVLTVSRENTSSLSNVSGSATSVSLLASNANRKVAKFYNDSSAILYLKEGTTASTTSFTTKLFPEGYYETTYTGAIDGIWASATGAVRITELT